MFIGIVQQGIVQVLCLGMIDIVHLVVKLQICKNEMSQGMQEKHFC